MNKKIGVTLQIYYTEQDEQESVTSFINFNNVVGINIEQAIWYILENGFVGRSEYGRWFGVPVHNIVAIEEVLEEDK